MIKIGLASDHAGFELKEFIKNHIVEKGYICIDFGAYSAESCDYPDFAHLLAGAVEAGEIGETGEIGEAGEAGEIGETGKGKQLFSYSVIQSTLRVDLGIALCGSGNGIGMTLNKHQGIRAAICWNVEVAKVVRAHNDANILVLPARFISREEAIAMIDTFLSTPFEGGRHQRRIEKIPLSR